jgi:SAM-dependent methyltransferase
MQETIDQTNYRREKQISYNTTHGITPTALNKPLDETLRMQRDRPEVNKLKPLSEKEIPNLSEGDIQFAGQNLEEYLENKQLTLIAKDIYEVDIDSIGKFDFIFMKDVIEHIPNQEKFMHFLKGFMNEKGVILFAFPPWYMPFGGHQQVCKNKLASKLPFYHILPNFIYRFILKTLGESKETILSLSDIKSTGISIERFERIIKKEEFKLIKKTSYLFNPNYEIKFNLTPKKIIFPFNQIPFFRNFYTTCMYYLIGK